MAKLILAQQSYVDEGFRQMLEIIEDQAVLTDQLAAKVKRLERELETERRLRLAMKR